MKKLLFVLNPRSGKAQIKNRLMDILDIFIKGGYEVMVHVTQGPFDAKEIVERMGDQVDMIVCSGGDGTLNEVVSGAMKLQEIPRIGYIPAGSTNDFASSLKISKNMLKAALAVTEGYEDFIDIGKFCDERYFIYIAAFGAFTEVSYLTPQERKNILGHQAYMLEGIKSLSSIKSYSLVITCDDRVLEGDFIFGMVTNTISVGGFKGLVSQEVALNDGEFEVLLIRTPKTPMDLHNILSYMFLKEKENEYLHKFKTKMIQIESKEEIDWVLDGEYGGSHTSIEIQNLKSRIKIMKAV